MQFVTAWFGRLDTERGVIDTITAGHGPNLLLRADGSVEELEADVPPLGVLDHLPLDGVRELSLNPGDLLAIPTDGIFEAMDEQDRMYGTDRLIDVLRADPAASLEATLEHLRSDIEQFRDDRPPQDDRSILAIRRTG